MRNEGIINTQIPEENLSAERNLGKWKILVCHFDPFLTSFFLGGGVCTCILLIYLFVCYDLLLMAFLRGSWQFHMYIPYTKKLFYFIGFFLKHLYWCIITLQWCVSFCFITKWISYTYTYIPISPPSCISLPSSLSQPSSWSQSTELISLCYVAASH